MSVLVVGAGAAGGYIGAQLLAAGRDVTFLAHGRTAARLKGEGLRIRHGDDTRTLHVRAVTVAELDRHYDVVLVAVRTSAVEGAVRDTHEAVGPETRIVPVMNGIRHLSLLTAAFGQARVLGSTTRLITSQLPDGTIEEIAPGIQMEIGQLDGGDSDQLDSTAAELDVPNIDLTVRPDVVAAMWEKFAFITATAVFTCLIGDVIGSIARADGGIDLARAVLAEVRRGRTDGRSDKPRSAAQELLRDSFTRLIEHVDELTDGLTEEVASYQPTPHANSIAWLIWHSARVQDVQVCDIARSGRCLDARRVGGPVRPRPPARRHGLRSQRRRRREGAGLGGVARRATTTRCTT